MSYNNKIIRRVHNHLFAPLEWLERIEQRHDTCYQVRTGRPLPAYLSATLAGLESALEQMIESLHHEEQRLFDLIKNAGRASLLGALQPRRQQIFMLTGQLLNSITTIRTMEKSNHTSSAFQAQQYRSGEDSWDDALRLVRDINNQLVRYLYMAESTYLPIADYLLGPSGQIEISCSSEIPPASAITSAALVQTYAMQSQQLH